VLYSNRSGAYAAQADFKAALIDANECIKLNEEWAKGHSRRGAAYFGLKNWPAAQTAYERGLELDPSSAVMKAELDKVKLKRNPAARAAAEAAAGSSQYQRYPGDAGGYPASGSCGPPSGPMAKTAATSLCLGVLITGFLYMLPLFPRYAMPMYKVCILNLLILFVLHLVTAFPLKLATLTDAKFKAAQESQAFMLLLFMLLSPPMPFALMPFLSVALLHASPAIKEVAVKLPGPLKSIIGDRITYLCTAEGRFHVQSFGAVSEVIVAVMAPLLCVVQGMQAAILGFFFFQYVVRRYRNNELTVKAVDLFVERVDSLGKHRFVPMPVQTLYGKVKSVVGYAATKLVS